MNKRIQRIKQRALYEAKDLLAIKLLSDILSSVLCFVIVAYITFKFLIALAG